MRLIYSFILIALLFFPSWAMAAGCTSDTNAELNISSEATSHTMSFTIADNTNRYLGVFITYGAGTTITISDVDWNTSEAMTSRVSAVVDEVGLDYHGEYFDLVNPTNGTHDITFTTSANAKPYIVAYSIYEVDQTTPRLDTDKVDDGNGTSSTLTLTDDTDCVMGVLDMLTARDLVTGLSTGEGADQTVNQFIEPNSTSLDVASSSQNGSDDGVMSWSWTNAHFFLQVAVALQAAPVTSTRPRAVITIQ